MASWRSTLIISGLLTALALAPSVRAADGRITFTGAILAPTCAPTSQDASTVEGGSRARACQAPGATTQAAAARYTVSVTELTRLAMDDRLRRYFTDFIAVDDTPVQTRLVVQTYL